MIDDTIYLYDDILVDKGQNALPLSILNCEKYEALFIRLIFGSISITRKYDNIVINQRKNYSYLGIKENSKMTYKIFDEFILENENKQKIDSYLVRNLQNESFYHSLCFEFTNYLFSMKNKDFVTAFVYLYRCVEFMAYPMPFIFASAGRTGYGKIFNDLKLLFDDAKPKNAGELKLYDKFLEIVVDTEILNSNFVITPTAPTYDMYDEINSVVKSIITNFEELYDGKFYSIKYRDLINFIIILRNKYFHMLAGDSKGNIQSTKMLIDFLFQGINEGIANWIAFLYYEMIKKVIIRD